jgi:hypothetical protein
MAKRGLIGAGLDVGGGAGAMVPEALPEISGVSTGIGGGAGPGATTLIAPQSGQAGRFTG